MTKKLLLALLCLALLFSGGCTTKTVINNYPDSAQESDGAIPSDNPYTTESSVTDKTITVKPDTDQNFVSSYNSDRKEPINIIASGEQSSYSPYYFSRLTNRQKAIYNKLLSAALRLDTNEIYVCPAENYKKSDISIAYMAFSTDYPDVFWLDGKYTILAYQENDVILDYYVKISYDRSYEQAINDSLALKEKVEEIIAGVDLSNVLVTEKYFHDYLCKNVEYNLEYNDDNYNAFGALLNGKAVCEGYSRAMLLLCKTVGINGTLARGTADNGENDNLPHMWNVIEIYGKWYHVDVTWDDPIRENPTDNEPIYNYFNLFDSQMYENHTPYINLTNESLDQITDSNYNYYLPLCSER